MDEPRRSRLTLGRLPLSDSQQEPEAAMLGAQVDGITASPIGGLAFLCSRALRRPLPRSPGGGAGSVRAWLAMLGYTWMAPKAPAAQGRRAQAGALVAAATLSGILRLFDLLLLPLRRLVGRAALV
jgi:hypothetical protein